MLTLPANDVICNPSGRCAFIYQTFCMLTLCCHPGPVPWTPTLAAVLLVAVVHAVEDLVAAPTPRDAVSSVQTQELVLPALLHAADLAGQEAADVRASHPSTALFEWIIGYWRSGEECFEEWRSRREAALTSSEPSRQLSCPSHRRLAETQPPLAHTYSLREHVGRTEQALVDMCVWRSRRTRPISSLQVERSEAFGRC